MNIRFFAGASSGTVILGTPPQSKAFKQNFDWFDAVIEFPNYATNAEVIADLNAQPECLKKYR